MRGYGLGEARTAIILPTKSLGFLETYLNGKDGILTYSVHMVCLNAYSVQGELCAFYELCSIVFVFNVICSCLLCLVFFNQEFTWTLLFFFFFKIT